MLYLLCVRNIKIRGTRRLEVRGGVYKVHCRFYDYIASVTLTLTLATVELQTWLSALKNTCFILL